MAWQNTRARRLQQWDRIMHRRYPDWDERRQAALIRRAAGEGIKAVSVALGLSTYMVRSLEAQEKGMLLAENRRGKAVSAGAPEKEESWREINRKLSAAVKRLEQGRG